MSVILTVILSPLTTPLPTSSSSGKKTLVQARSDRLIEFIVKSGTQHALTFRFEAKKVTTIRDFCGGIM